MKRCLMIISGFGFLFSAIFAGAGYAQATSPITAWGSNNAFQCDVPPPNADFAAVAANGNFSLGLKLDSTIVAWGSNSSGQCDVPSPNAGFIAVAAGQIHSLALKYDGTIVAWGDNSAGECDVPLPNADFIAVAAGGWHGLGLKPGGTIVAWGYNVYGQCDVPLPNADFVAVAGGDNHSLGLKSDGTIVAWGQNSYGQCDVPAPNANFVDIAGGGSHSIGLKSDGTIVAWGSNADGQCDIPSPNASFAAVAAGLGHSLGLKLDGTVVAWGNNNHGQCDVPFPNAAFAAVAGGNFHSLGLRSDDPICVVSPTGIDLGTVLVGAYKDTTFVIKNIGYGPMVGSVGEPCDQFDIISGGSYDIAPGDSQIVTVRFAPLVAHVDSCHIDTGTECDEVVIRGYGQGPVCATAPDSLAYGFVTIGQHKDLEFIVTNIGGGRLTGSVTESCERYSIVSGGGAYDLGHGDTLHVTVRFEPLVTGLITCSVSSGGLCGSIVCRGTGDRMPRIYAVRDVPGDQGGYLNVAWDAAPGDNPTEHAITRYTVWRAIEPTAAELASLDPGSFIERISDVPAEAKAGVVRRAELESMKYYWKLISSLDAYYLEAYSEVVPTLFDSTDACTEYHYVQIIAHSADPYVFWASPPDSGRSVDNLAPGTPLYLAAERSYVPEGLALTWAPNREFDLAHYAVYRGSTEDFVPAPENLLATPADTMCFDDEWRWDERCFYKVSAFDVHGNESGYAILRPEDVTGDEMPDAPRATYLAQNFPNPFNPVTRIEFGLAAPAAVRLRIYDVAGRLVRELEDAEMPAGLYVKIWNGRDARGAAVASGIYFYRLDAGSFTATRKMVLLK